MPVLQPMPFRYVSDAVTVDRQYAALTQAAAVPLKLDENSTLATFEIDHAANRSSLTSPNSVASSEAKRLSMLSKQITEAETPEGLSKQADAESSSDWKWVLKRWEKKTTPKAYAVNRECQGTRIPLLTATDPLEPRLFRLDRLGQATAPFNDR